VAKDVAIVRTHGAELCLKLGGPVVFDIRDGVVGCVKDRVDAVLFGDVVIVIFYVEYIREMDPIQNLRELTGVCYIEPCDVTVHLDGIEHK
jgi:hypothetical protein